MSVVNKFEHFSSFHGRNLPDTQVTYCQLHVRLSYMYMKSERTAACVMQLCGASTGISFVPKRIEFDDNSAKEAG